MAAATGVVNSVTGYTAGVQWTATAGGSALEWFTPQLQATTLAGEIFAAVRTTGAAGTVRVEVASCNNDGTNVTVYGSTAWVLALSAGQSSSWIPICGPDLSITQGQRLRFRMLLDDHEAALDSGNTATTYYDAGTLGASGDAFFILPVALTEYVAASPIGRPVLPGFFRPQFTRPRRRIMS